MSQEIAIALISGGITLVVSLTASILTFISNQKKLKQEQEKMFKAELQSQNQKIEEMKAEIKDTLQMHKEVYISQINEVHSTIAEIKAENQQYQATMDIRIDHMTDQFMDMKTEVREHNNFAKRLPVLEEQMKVANNRIKDLEENEKR